MTSELVDRSWPAALGRPRDHSRTTAAHAFCQELTAQYGISHVLARLLNLTWLIRADLAGPAATPAVIRRGRRHARQRARSAGCWGGQENDRRGDFVRLGGAA
jgi:hypothetical protein